MSSNQELLEQHRSARQLLEIQFELNLLSYNEDAISVQKRILQAACQVMHCKNAALYWQESPVSEWLSRKSLSQDGDLAYQAIRVDHAGWVKECLLTGKTLSSNLSINENRQLPPEAAQSEVMLLTPLEINNWTQGVLEVSISGNEAVPPDAQETFGLFAKVASSALRTAYLVQALKLTAANLHSDRWDLLKSSHTLRALFDNLPSGIYIIDAQYHLVAINKIRSEKIRDIPEQGVPQTCFSMLFQRTSPCPKCRAMETFLDGASTQRFERRTLVGGEPTHWEISTYPIYDDESQIIQVILLEQDITERRRLENILTQSEKLAAVGQLAAGVAHEINNPLTAIIANAQIIQKELPPGHDLQESAELIARAGARAAQVVRNLLDFARKEDFNLSLIDINENLHRSLELVQHEFLANNVDLEFLPDPNLPSILASEDHLQSVWLNLLLNAIDSLDKRPGKIRLSTLKLSKAIQVSVIDNGKGIPPERLSRIFEPFYTTKAPGRGTGLGLSVSHRIIKQHGGSIHVESQLGSGSEFTVTLPLT